MKFILDGRTYDTVASAKAAHCRADTADGSVREESILYRTPRGAFFLHTHRATKSAGKPIITDSAQAMTATEAVYWIIKEGAVVLTTQGLQLPADA